MTSKTNYKDKMREEFEKWEKKEYPESKLTYDTITKEYVRSSVEADWRAYKAAKESDRKELEESRVDNVRLNNNLGQLSTELEAARQRIADFEDTLKRVQKQSSDRLIGLCKCGDEREALEKKLAEQQPASKDSRKARKRE